MQSYSITNIKSFKNYTEVQAKPITIFVGKNSCGKSSLMRFPVVLSQTVKKANTSPLRFYGELIDYGYYDNVVFNNSTEPIEFSIKYNMDIVYDDYARFRKEDALNPVFKDVVLKVSLGKENKRVVILKNELYIDDTLCYGLYRESKGKCKIKIFETYDFETESFSKHEYEILVEHCTSERFFITFDASDRFEAIKKAYFTDDLVEDEIRIEDGVVYPLDLFANAPMYACRRIFKSFVNSNPDSENYQSFISLLIQFAFYSDLLRNVYDQYDEESYYTAYIGPFRKNPERVYRDEEFQTKQVGSKGENVTAVLIWDLQRKKELIERISAWVKRTVGYNLAVDEVSTGMYSLVLEDENGIKTNLMDVGYGISQILPIIVQILVDNPRRRNHSGSPTDNLIIIEQPELHLHPAAQSELADLFVDGVFKGQKKILIETHSEHLIRKMQVLVADPECDLSCDDIAIYYVDKDENGVASIKELKMAPNGQFEEDWPSGFFDKAFELSMELLKASTKQG